MPILSSFTFMTLDGFYKGLNEDISWHKHGGEEAEFSENNLKSRNTLVFGRTTYEMMRSFWTSGQAAAMLPAVAKGMNASSKIVFSRKLKKADWQNTKLLNDDPVRTMRDLKRANGPDMTILGSGEILRQLADAGLVDEFQIMVDPVAIGKGVSLFGGLKESLSLQLISTRTFKSGCMLLCYRPSSS